MEPVRWSRYLIILVLLALNLYGCQSAAKPQTKTEMPALVFADQYALYIARHQYKQALAVSTSENAKLINSEIKPFLQQLAIQNGKQRLSFKEVQFLSSYLIQGDEGHLLVIEALVPASPLKTGERVILHYEVREKKPSYEVVTSHLRLDNGDDELIK